MNLRSFWSYLLPFCLAAGSVAPSALAYTIPPPNPSATNQENFEILQRMSKGVAAIAKQANEAIVFVSVYKNVQGNGLPPGSIDPFEFFFGPNGPGAGRGGRGGGPGPRGEGPGGRGGQQGPQRREGGVGSGFFIDLKQGYILTNNHVVQDADEIQLKLANGDSYEGKVVGRDQNTDVAVVQVKDTKFNRTGLAELILGKSEAVEVGDFVVALGAPFGLEASLSFGVVSAIGRGNLDIAKVGNFIQTDAAINPGNSGGPLLDMHGQVVGINTAIYSKTGGYNGIGFSVPSSLVRTVAEQLINEGYIQRGYLGVQLQGIDEEMRQGLNLPAGVHGGALVAKVQGNGPAQKAGIESGDVITEVNGTAMKVYTEIVNTIGLMKPGTKVTLGLYRDGKKRDFSLAVGQHPDDKVAGKGRSVASDGGDDDAPAGARGSRSIGFGMSAATLTTDAAASYNLESKKGALITDVQADSPADRAGLQNGDLILKADGKSVATVDDLASLTKGKNKVIVWVERGGEFYFVPLKKT